MIFKAFPSFTNNLVLQPETGMGYQVVEAKKPGKHTTDLFVIYNSQLILEYDSSFDYYKRLINPESINLLYNKSEFLTIDFLKVLKADELPGRTHITNSPNIIGKGRIIGGIGAKDAPIENADGFEVFVRLSAFENDKRIDFENKRLKPGSYTTTEKDYMLCKAFNDNPNDRYALPNDDLIKWAFYIQPQNYDKLQRGTVQPAFGKIGGGVEAFFKEGTSSGTYQTILPY